MLCCTQRDWDFELAYCAVGNGTGIFIEHTCTCMLCCRQRDWDFDLSVHVCCTVSKDVEILIVPV